MNYYGERDRMINRNTKILEYLRCSYIETWEYVIIYRTIVDKRIDFIIKKHSKLKQNKLKEILNEELQTVVDNIRRYLRGNNKDYETNQITIGIKYLFRGMSIKE